MKLISGKEVTALSQIQIDNKTHVICKLPNPVYLDGTLVSIILLPPSSFQQYVDEIHKSSEEIAVKVPTENMPEESNDVPVA